MVDVFIGYDEREDAAYQVCCASILRHASIPVRIHALDEKVLRATGFYWRPWRYNYDPYSQSFTRQKVDMIDGRPFSTDFAFTRFLVPALMQNLQRTGPAIFVDCDFLFRDDIAKLVGLFDPEKCVQVVKHKYEPTDETKMDGQIQQVYPRKNWSSLMMFNTEAVMISVPTVNRMAGRWLHGFEWVGGDDKIGDLPEAWNWLEGHSSDRIEPKAVHFTRGGPWFPDYQDVEYAEEWLAYRNGHVLVGFTNP